MAKRVKRSKTRTVTKTRKIYVSAKRKARKIKRAAGERMSAADIALAVGGAGVGSIGGSILLSKMPDAIPDVAKNGILAAAGGFLAYKGLKKKNKLFLGLGLGAAAAGATNLIANVISGSTVSGCSALSAPYTQLSAPYTGLNGSESAYLASPLSAPYDGEEM